MAGVHPGRGVRMWPLQEHNVNENENDGNGSERECALYEITMRMRMMAMVMRKNMPSTRRECQ